MRLALALSLIVNLALGYHLYQSHMHLLEHRSESEAETAEEKAQAAAVLMLGDSITAQGEWGTALGRDDVANRGIPGYTTGQLIWTIKNGLADHPEAQVWFLQGGINDLSLGVSADRVYANYLTSVDSLQRNNKVPVVQSVIL
ncbi:MAG: GDSL-type esterase/lipase family protein, partial [Bacteroidota bacterium]